MHSKHLGSSLQLQHLTAEPPAPRASCGSVTASLPAALGEGQATSEATELGSPGPPAYGRHPSRPPAHTHTPQPVEGPATLSVRMQSTKTTFTFSPDSALIPITTEDLCGGVPCSLQGATTFQGKFLYSCCAASEGTAAHSTGLLLRNGRKLKCRKLK